ncbi:MAG: galactokinase [Archangiaceae bacterium]|nr:galactokinase [Archangiaceae bacterium]
MIIGRSPLRISIGGGGTDLPSYYLEHGGFCISAAIDKYVFVSMQRTTVNEMLLRYSQIERVSKVEEIKHPIIREALLMTGIAEPNIEITSMADIPAGTGLGSSGSFTTCLLRVLHQYKRHFIHPRELAEAACHIELERLKDPIGKQDQYIAAFGGVTVFDFKRDGQVEARPLAASEDTLAQLEDNLLLFATGYSRSAGSILKEQDSKTKGKDAGMVANLHYVKELGQRILEHLERGEIAKFGELMHEHWLHKKKRSASMSNPDIDRWYQLGLDNGALGGKLIGAGGGGFLLFYTEQKGRLRRAMAEAGLHEVVFAFDFQGTKIIV